MPAPLTSRYFKSNCAKKIWHESYHKSTEAWKWHFGEYFVRTKFRMKFRTKLLPKSYFRDFFVRNSLWNMTLEVITYEISYAISYEILSEVSHSSFRTKGLPKKLKIFFLFWFPTFIKVHLMFMDHWGQIHNNKQWWHKE